MKSGRWEKEIMRKKLMLAAVCTMVLSGCSGQAEKPPVTGETETVETSAAETTKTTETEATEAAGSSGTFTGTGSGYGGPVEVQVEFADGKIVDFEIVSGNETSLLEKRAIPVLKERVLEAQSPAVDSVSGATFTSFAVKAAIADAGSQAGLDYGQITMSTQGPEAERRDLEAVQTQLVVVGGGPAGLSAAIAAKEAGVEDVILIEKLDILSGNGKFDMNFFDLINSQAMKEAGIEITKEEFIESKSTAMDSEERKVAWAEGEYELDEWLRGMGAELNQSNGGTNHMAEKDAYAGEEIQDALEAKAIELGIDIRTGTKGLDLIMEDDRVTGVKVQNKNDYYDIMADVVILATGGFSHNKELLAQYAPGSETVATSNQMGATGDFVPLFEQYGFKLENMDNLSVFKMILKPRRDLTGAGDGFILVNENGERFVDETSSGLPLAHTILEQPNGKVFYIYDETLYETSYRLEKHNKLGYHVQADTLEELAEKLGIPAENLTAAVDSFNQSANGEAEDPFRKEAFSRPFNEAGPYYGAQVESAIHMTKGGVVANEKAQVLFEDGSVVEGLYAAGEVTATTGAYSAAVVFGRISGQEAAGEILGQ